MKPVERATAVYDRLASSELHPVWISQAPREVSLERARSLEATADVASPVYGLPFAIKDNIDLEGLPTTAGCPGYAYSPGVSALVVRRLMKAGAIPIGKTNMDQFATGLVGTRSPYGACSSVFDSRYISGGSSSGSAVAVASGMVEFALGTDTAGSGRVPAAFNGVVGLKPTRGLLSMSGVVPACRSLDCVSIFTRTCREAVAVWHAARGFDASDPYSRQPQPGDGAAPWISGPFRFGVPAAGQLEFFGDDAAAELFERAVRRFEEIGGHRVEIDFAPFRAVADLLYCGPWVAERYAAVGGFLESHEQTADPVVRRIILGGRRHSAADAFSAEYRLRELRRRTDAEWSGIDVMLLPTAGTLYTHEQVAADPIGLNTNLGYYTNFVNLLDLAAVAVPAGFRTNGLPFGVSVLGPAFTDEALLAIAGRFCGEAEACAGARQGLAAPGCISVAVVGAHLSGQPLNWQLTDLGARLLKTCRTAPGYRLYALSGSIPPKPGLVRDGGYAGPGIEVEVWAVPENRFGGFVAAVPSPLGIGSVTLDSGAVVSCFIAEPCAIHGSPEITQYGGWRSFLAAGGI